jgi:copper(I)-binding protein
MRPDTQFDAPLSLRRLTAGATLLLLFIGLLMACGSEAPAGPQIEVQDVWSRPAVAVEEISGESGGGEMGMGHAKGGTGAVYMKLVNTGQEADRLVSAQTDVAEVVEIHETRMEGDVMMMQMLPDGLEIPAQGEVELKPGGYHVMLIGLKQDLKEGDQYTVVLEFAKSGPMTVEPKVRQP